MNGEAHIWKARTARTAFIPPYSVRIDKFAPKPWIFFGGKTRSYPSLKATTCARGMMGPKNLHLKYSLSVLKHAHSPPLAWLLISVLVTQLIFIWTCHQLSDPKSCFCWRIYQPLVSIFSVRWTGTADIRQIWTSVSRSVLTLDTDQAYFSTVSRYRDPNYGNASILSGMFVVLILWVLMALQACLTPPVSWRKCVKGHPTREHSWL